MHIETFISIIEGCLDFREHCHLLPGWDWVIIGLGTKIKVPRGTRLLKMCLTFQNQARFELVKAHYVCILQGVGECMDLFLLQAMFVLISGTNIKNRPANC